MPEKSAAVSLDSESKDASVAGKRSVIAEDVEAIRQATINSALAKDRQPSQLFWTLFATRINKVKNRKDLERLIRLLSS